MRRSVKHRSLERDWRVNSTSYHVDHKPSRRTAVIGDEVGAYMRAIGEHPLLTNEGEKYLFGLIHTGDEQTVKWARKKAIESNLRLVVSIAKRYPLSTQYDFIDLIGVGNLGLEHAVDLFRVERGFKFSTYSTFWIKQAIGRYIDNNTLDVKAAGDEVSLARRADKILEASSLDKNSSIADIAYALGVTVAIAERVMGMRNQGYAVRLDKEVGEDGEMTLGGLLNVEGDEFVNEILKNDQTENFMKIIKDFLDPEEFEIIMTRTGFLSEDEKAVSFRELGEKFGEYTPEWMRRRTNSILDKLRGHLLREYPEMQELVS